MTEEENSTQQVINETTGPSEGLKKAVLATMLLDESGSRKKTKPNLRMPEGTSVQGEGNTEKKEDVGVKTASAAAKNGAATLAKWAAIGTGGSFLGILYSSGSSDTSAQVLTMPSHAWHFLTKIIEILS
ncbi:hypothetical protein HZA40_01420 [Candidatus Peregrinibacteria bacterium]|nr:hypothetical protein [Candidatus Peregrinibacteria bacterium]MBI5753784.1 hypothetical protein [Candidatus Peregrinibacteria bacterium]